MKKKIISGGILAGVLGLTPVLGNEMPSAEEMWALIKAQQEQINELRALVEANQSGVSQTQQEVKEAQAEATSANERLATTQAQLEATTLVVEEMATAGEQGDTGLGWWEKTSIGGYGELHANFYNGTADELDFHRFVLFVSHEYNDWISLFTEWELEHALAGEGKEGEVELEQAFVQLDWTESFSTDVGLFLMPVGILNETHEPATFYGVERNSIESRIIPTTWWEGGVLGKYRMDNGVAFDFGLVSGLNTGASGSIRGGRQKVSEAINTEASFVGRVKYTGIPGLEVAASAFYQGDLAQDDPEEVPGLLTTAHIIYQKSGFGFRALYAHWDLDDTLDPLAEKQYGYYLEPSYRFTFSEKYGDLGVYFRFSDYEYYTGSTLSENEIYEIGINYWPTEGVVLKADIQDISNADEKASKGDRAINVGFGYHF